MPSSCNIIGFKLAHDQYRIIILLTALTEEKKKTDKQNNKKWSFEAWQMFNAMGHTKDEFLVEQKDFSGLIKKNKNFIVIRLTQSNQPN